jgi:carboxypeptidase family protein
MPRPTTIVIYSGVFVVALLVGLLISFALMPRSLPSASFAATPTAPAQAPARTAAIAQRSIAAQATVPPPPAPTVAQPTADPPAPIGLNVEPPTTTPTPEPATPTPTQVPTQPPRPLTFTARVFDKPTDAAVACGSAFESRIWGVVRDSAGRGIYRAAVQVSSADGKHRYSQTTNNQGGFEIPGLGCTTWVVRLAAVPRAAEGFQAQPVRVTLNGGRYSGAGIEFRQR